MTETWVPSPPAQTVWWDPAATFASIMNTLRLQQIDVDADKLKALIPAAGEQINDYLDRTDPLAVAGFTTVIAIAGHDLTVHIWNAPAFTTYLVIAGDGAFAEDRTDAAGEVEIPYTYSTDGSFHVEVRNQASGAVAGAAVVDVPGDQQWGFSHVYPALQAALERLVIMLYHGIDPDPIGTIAAQLTPAKQRFGIG